jgi:hypothetical protein
MASILLGVCSLQRPCEINKGLARIKYQGSNLVRTYPQLPTLSPGADEVQVRLEMLKLT